MKQFDVEYVRAQFPAMARTVNGLPVAYLDGPGGTQVPQRVVDAVTDYLLNHNCNIHGLFATSEETDAIIDGAHRALADLLGADWSEVSFGTNMTTITTFMAQSPGARLEARATRSSSRRSITRPTAAPGCISRSAAS